MYLQGNTRFSKGGAEIETQLLLANRMGYISPEDFSTISSTLEEVMKMLGSLIKKFRTHKDDTGSPEVQIAILSKEIEQVSEHLKARGENGYLSCGPLDDLRVRLFFYLG